MTSRNTIDDFDGADIFDMRAVTDRYETLEDERDSIKGKRKLAAWENAEEFRLLGELLEETKGNGGDHDWRGDWYPVTMIRDSYFIDYAEEMLKDIGALPSDMPGYLVIDWEATADNIRQDYQSVEFNGTTYWYR